MIVVIYGVIVGIQTLSRASEILFIIMMLGLLFAVLFLVNTKFVLNIDNLFPMFENGILFPIKKGWSLITFPYGEFAAFTMLYKNLNDTRKIKKIAISAVILEGVCLTIINILFITALGVNFASSSVFPLLETLRLIKIGGFLERLDIIIIVTMVTGGFMKISFFMYFSVLGITDFFNIKSTKLLSIIVGIIILFSSELIAKNFPQHLKIGLDVTVKYIHLPMQTIIPLLALITAWLKNKSKNKTY
jgi:spore germination protein KB